MSAPQESASPRRKVASAHLESWPLHLDQKWAAGVVRELCSWFDEHRRDLPWRRTSDPYSIWISEAMLQQTRVETVLEYHARFMARLPSVRHLAEASESEVLALWSGLGYYRRARSLHAAAKQIMSCHAGRIPSEREVLMALPGVGPYTAGALLSIAFQRAEPLVDGNVARVFSRLFGIREEISSAAAQRLIWGLASFMVPGSLSSATWPDLPRICPGNWNQALMELGALVCTPKAPSCLLCPLHEECSARREGLTSELPRKAARPKPLDVRIEILLIGQGERWLLVQRPMGGRMAGLWELPTRERVGEGVELHGLWPADYSLGELGPGLELGPEIGRVAHAITKHRIQGRLFAARIRARASIREQAGLRWVTSAQIEQLGVTGLTHKCLAKLATWSPEAE